MSPDPGPRSPSMRGGGGSAETAASGARPPLQAAAAHKTTNTIRWRVGVISKPKSEPKHGSLRQHVVAEQLVAFTGGVVDVQPAIPEFQRRPIGQCETHSGKHLPREIRAGAEPPDF